MKITNNHGPFRALTIRLLLVSSLALLLLSSETLGALPGFASKETLEIPFRNQTVTVKLPGGKDPAYKEAVALMSLAKKFAEAEKMLTEVVQRKSTSEGWLALAISREALGKLDEATQAYVKAKAAPGLSGLIKEECEAGMARIEARRTFAKEE